MPTMLDLLMFGLAAGAGAGTSYYWMEFAHDRFLDWLDDRGTDQDDDESPSKPIQDTTADDPSVRRDKQFIPIQGTGHTYGVTGDGLVHRAECAAPTQQEFTALFRYDTVDEAYGVLTHDLGFKNADCCEPFAAIEEVV